MALNFDASTEKVVVTRNTTIDNVNLLTSTNWIWLDVAQTNSRIWQKGIAGTHGLAHYFSAGVGTSSFWLAWTGAANLDIIALYTSFAHYGTGKWLFAVAQQDTTNLANCKILIGDLNNPPAEPSVYGTKTLGSGPDNDSVADLVFAQVGNNAGPFDGKMASAQWFPSILTDKQLKQVWQGQRFHLTRRLDFEFGFPGAGNQQDLSGNGNTGVVTGANVSAHLPQRPNPLGRYVEDDPYVIASVPPIGSAVSASRYRSRYRVQDVYR